MKFLLKKCYRPFSLFLIFFVFCTTIVEAKRCPFCMASVTENVKFCWRCLRAVAWPEKPRYSLPAYVVARTGIDAFIRGPNDGHPNNNSFQNAGGDEIGPIGSFYSTTGFRYLIRFDIMKAFSDANISMKDFVPDRVTLVLRTTRREDARDVVPIAVYSLTRPFEEGTGIWGRHWWLDDGCNWENAAPPLYWNARGGDFDGRVKAGSFLPRSGEHEVEINVTNLYKPKFEFFNKTNHWEDFGIIIMRDPTVYSRCQYRTIYGFQASSEKRVLSPELYFE